MAWVLPADRETVLPNSSAQDEATPRRSGFVQLSGRQCRSSGRPDPLPQHQVWHFHCGAFMAEHEQNNLGSILAGIASIIAAITGLLVALHDEDAAKVPAAVVAETPAASGPAHAASAPTIVVVQPSSPAAASTSLPSGHGMQVCGCWGPNPAPTAPEPRCASGSVRVSVCEGFCAPGHPRYAYVCL